VISSPVATLYNPRSNQQSFYVETSRSGVPYSSSRWSFEGLEVNFLESMTAVSKSDMAVDLLGFRWGAASLEAWSQCWFLTKKGGNKIIAVILTCGDFGCRGWGGWEWKCWQSVLCWCCWWLSTAGRGSWGRGHGGAGQRRWDNIPETETSPFLPFSLYFNIKDFAEPRYSSWDVDIYDMHSENVLVGRIAVSFSSA
jgi:hypothetical protein